MGRRSKDREPGEEEELLSSGQVSPICQSAASLSIWITLANRGDLPAEVRTNTLGVLSEGLGPGPGPSPGSSALNLTASDYQRRLSAFNQKRPLGRNLYQTRVSSWADPVSAREIWEGDRDNDAVAESRVASASEVGNQRRRARFPGKLGVVGEEEVEAEVEEGRSPRGLVHRVRR